MLFIFRKQFSLWIKSLSVIILILLLTVAAKGAIDTSGLYLSKDDFINNHLRYETAYRLTIKGRPLFPIFRSFFLNADGAPIKVDITKNESKSFQPGSVFGFNYNGIKYIYSKNDNLYLALIWDKSPMYLAIKEKVHFSGATAFADDIFLYSKDLVGPMKEFNEKNITTDFADDKNTMNTLLKLMGEINKKQYNIEMHKKQFIECKNLIAHHLTIIDSR